MDGREYGTKPGHIQWIRRAAKVGSSPDAWRFHSVRGRDEFLAAGHQLYSTFSALFPCRMLTGRRAMCSRTGAVERVCEAACCRPAAKQRDEMHGSTAETGNDGR
jgi:hypothetical protein